MAIHDIDFAKKTLKSNQNTSNKPKKTQSFSRYIIIFFLGYSLGLYSGFYLFKFKHLEETLIKNPDTLEESEKSYKKQENFSNFSNISKKEGEYLIFVGALSPKRASEIIRSLKKEELFSSFSFSLCKGFNEKDSIETKMGIFRIPSLDGKIHKLYLGCFLTENQAFEAIRQLKNIEILNKQKLEVVQIVE